MTSAMAANTQPPHPGDDRIQEFAGSELFRKLFREGMGLVEEAAAYLDGAGREDAKRLGRAGALSYAAESMSLTTRLMQTASWLLTQRAVGEREMSPAEAADAKYRLPADKGVEARWPADEDHCPAKLADLAERSKTLYERLARVDANLFSQDARAAAAPANPVARQLSVIETAFGGRA